MPLLLLVGKCRSWDCCYSVGSFGVTIVLDVISINNGKEAHIVFGGTFLCRIWATREKEVKQHDVLIDLLSEDEKTGDIGFSCIVK